MNAYVLGAGVSNNIGYPLGHELFGAIDSFVRNYQKETNRFDFSDWPGLCNRLENANILVQQAYKFTHFELLMTALDLYKLITNEFIKQNRSERKRNRASGERLGKRFDSFYEQSYSKDRQTLLFALAEYFQHRHFEDQHSFASEAWANIQLFGKNLKKGDTIITFNYDSCMERVLLAQKKWYPRDGFGFTVEFENGGETPESDVIVLHLHGSTGWYKTPRFCSWNSGISLSPEFLNCLDLPYIDSTLPEVTDETEVFLHPTYLKTFELVGLSSSALINLWRSAARELAKADRIFVIGYSLPEADSAAMSLLLSTSTPSKVEIVNSSREASGRLSHILGRKSVAPPRSFSDWVKNSMR